MNFIRLDCIVFHIEKDQLITYNDKGLDDIKAEINTLPTVDKF